MINNNNNNKGCDASRVSDTAKLAVQLTIAVFTSTVHCQDFKDVDGDRLTGRCTVPIVFPMTSRLVVGLGLPIWSYLLCCIWDVGRFCTLAFVAYGCFVGGRFLCLRTRDADKRSCKYYSVSDRFWAVLPPDDTDGDERVLQVWFSLHHLLPGYCNYFHGSDAIRGGDLLQKTWDLFSGTSLLKAF